MRCPVDGCRGFVGGGAKSACGLCGVKVCPHCEVLVDEGHEHVCAEADLATVEELAKTTKSCPGCQAPITKVSGCNHMWCPYPGCGVAFDWVTLRISRGGIAHNPMFYEFQARQARERAQEPVTNEAQSCVGPADVTPEWLSSRTPLCIPGIAAELMAALRIASHMGDRRTLRGHSVRERSQGGFDPRTPEGLQAMRAAEYDRAGTKYLLGLTTEAEWRAELQVAHKRHEMNDELIQVYKNIFDFPLTTSF